jgi:hypothetical protein
MQEKKKPQIINAVQLSFILNVSEQTIKKLAKHGEIPCAFVNRRPQFNLNEIINHFQKTEGGAA